MDRGEAALRRRPLAQQGEIRLAPQCFGAWPGPSHPSSRHGSRARTRSARRSPRLIRSLSRRAGRLGRGARRTPAARSAAHRAALRRADRARQQLEAGSIVVPGRPRRFRRGPPTGLKFTGHCLRHSAPAVAAGVVRAAIQKRGQDKAVSSAREVSGGRQPRGSPATGLRLLDRWVAGRFALRDKNDLSCRHPYDTTEAVVLPASLRLGRWLPAVLRRRGAAVP
jgi:hypothetical protein